MTRSRIHAAALAALLASFLRPLPAQAAADDVIATSPHPFTARGPLALSLAAEPSGLHWGMESGFPLGILRHDPTGRMLTNPWRVDVLMNASHDRASALDAASLGMALRLERSDARGATWWGVSHGGTSAPGDPEARLQLALGRLQSFGGMRGELTWVTSSVLFKTATQSFADSGNFIPDSTGTERGSHTALWHTAQGSLRWQRGRLALESVGGLSTGDGVRARRWAQAALNLQLSRRVMFMASLGERPTPALAFQSAAQPRTMLGVQVAPWAARGWGMSGALRPVANAWRSASAGHDQLLVRVHGRDVSRIELAGDFTDWSPVPLMPVHANWWAVMLRVPPGVHRVQLRLDGGPWLAPPGLPRADDGPGGPSGAVVVTGAD